MKRLEAIVSDRNRQRKHVERAEVILASVGGGPVQRIAERSALAVQWYGVGSSALCGCGRGRAAARQDPQAGKRPIAAETVARVVALTCGKPEGEVTHWTGRAMAQSAGISLTSVHRIWRAYDLKPHRVGSFKRSRDPHFADKLIDVAGLYLAPPTQAVVLSIDEKSQIQALDRTQLGLPLKSGHCATLTHDYIRHGTTTLFVALNVLDGTVIGLCMQRHRHEEFIRFLNTVEREVPDGKAIEAVVDNYATHKHPKVKAPLERNPR